MSTPFVSTHLTPIPGMDSWPRPDPQAAPGPRISENLEVQVLDRMGDWAKVVFSNGWSAWVDGRLLVPIRTEGGGVGSQANALPFDLSALLSDRPRGFAVGGALLVALSSVLPWARGGGRSANSFDTPAVWLVDYKTTSRGGIKIGLLLLLLSIATVVVTVRGSDKRVELGLGIASIAVPVLYLVQLQRAISSGEPGSSITDFAGFGILVAIAGGVLVLVAPRLRQRSG